MTRITIYLNSEKCITGFDVKGHSGYGEEGNDIVCAGISALAYAALGSLQAIAGKDISDAITEDGHMSFMLDDADDENSDLTSVIFAVMEVGYLQIQNSYDDYVKIDYKEV